MKETFSMPLPGNFLPIGFSVCRTRFILFSSQSFCIYENGIMTQHTLFPLTVSSAVFLSNSPKGYILDTSTSPLLYSIDEKGIIRNVYSPKITADAVLRSDPFGHVFILDHDECRQMYFSKKSVHLIPTCPSYICCKDCPCILSFEKGTVVLYSVRIEEQQILASREELYLLPK